MNTCELCGGITDAAGWRRRYCGKTCAGRAANERAAAATRKAVLHESLIRHTTGFRFYRFSEAEERAICEEYAHGSSTPAIARRHNTSRELVRNIVVRHKIPLRSRSASMVLHWKQSHAARVEAEARVFPPWVRPATPYIPFPALQPGACVGCGVPLEPTQRVCDACDVAGL